MRQLPTGKKFHALPFSSTENEPPISKPGPKRPKTEPMLAIFDHFSAP